MYSKVLFSISTSESAFNNFQMVFHDLWTNVSKCYIHVSQNIASLHSPKLLQHHHLLLFTPCKRKRSDQKSLCLKCLKLSKCVLKALDPPSLQIWTIQGCIWSSDLKNQMRPSSQDVQNFELDFKKQHGQVVGLLFNFPPPTYPLLNTRPLYHYIIWFNKDTMRFTPKGQILTTHL